MSDEPEVEAEQQREPEWVGSLSALAVVLNVPRTTLNEWRKREGAPRPRANGGQSVPQWREFMVRHDLSPTKAVGNDEHSLKQRKLKAEVELREILVEIKRGNWVRIEDVKADWVRKVSDATMMLRKKFEQELPPICCGLDAVGIQDECRRAIDEVLAALHAGEKEEE